MREVMESVELKHHESEVSLLKPESQKSWVERVFQKHECSKFIASTKDRKRCGCGRLKTKHEFDTDSPSTGMALPDIRQKWSPGLHTEASPTDAYGTLEFQGGPHPTKAQYVRLSYDSSPDQVLYLLQQHWNLELPKLLISVHGGIANFDLQPKLKRVFKKGLLKAAKTTGAWIVSAGINTGVVRHVGDALGDTLIQVRNNIVTLGIAPWAVVHNRADLIGTDIVTPYHAIAAPKTNNVVLNSNHSYFLLVDDGTVEKYGCEFVLRKKLEKFIQQQKISTRSGARNYGTPVVSLVLEGGTNTIRTVLECITDTPPVPVVVCDGSGRAADLLAFTHKYAQDDGTMPEAMRDQLLLTVEKTFQYTREQAEKLFIELMLCVKKKELITVFRMGEGSQDIDLEILTALLKAQNASCPGQLSLALAWNRVDIARSNIFVYGQEWPEGALDQAMMDALVNDRVDFVKLLLENGVSMQKWLTIGRLEELYNVKQDPGCTLRYLVKANKKMMRPGYRYSLYDIGIVLEQLMGGAYRASFCRKQFRRMYTVVMKKSSTAVSFAGTLPQQTLSEPQGQGPQIQVSRYPYHELMVWAVLLKRQDMAKFMWQHGEEALAKALVAFKLYKSMAHEAAQDDLEVDISEEFKGYAREFNQLSLDLLEQCYKNDDDITEQLLTYELDHWSDQTSLSLAISANHKEFIAHTSCQLLLTEMWMAGLRMRKYTTLKVILGILFFPSIVWLEFKTKEELQLMPQTMEEHMQDIDSDSDSDSDSDNNSISSKEKSSVVKPSTNAAQLPLPNGTALFNDLSITLKEKSKKSSLRLGKKIYEFYTAPITKFWVHTLGYIVFLVFLTYIVLIRMPPIPSWQEWFVISYLLTFTIEKIRELIVSEPKKLGQKLYVFYSEIWNISDTVAIIVFSVGVVLRFIPPARGIGKVFYCVDIIFWYIRLLDIFSVSKNLGPYVTMIGKMMKDLVNFVVILLIVLMAFGIVRQSVTFPNEEPSWDLAKFIFLKPYFMLYGEVYAPEIDPECSDTDPDNEYKCVPGRWVVPAVMTIYLIVANILLLNLLIAVFNNTFHQVNRISMQIWKFQRYILVIEYENKPILPPPFIILCHAYLLVRFIVRRCVGKRFHFDNGLKLFLDTEDIEKLHDFEEEAMEDLFRLKGSRFNNSMDERIKLTNERVENMSLRLDDINQKENSIRLSLQTVDYRMMKLEEMSLQMMESMTVTQQMVRDLQITNQFAALQNHQPSLPPSESNTNVNSNQPHPSSKHQLPHPAAAPGVREPLRLHIPSANPAAVQPHSPWTKPGSSQISKLDLPWVKKKKSRNEERLRPFTDYSRPYGKPHYGKSLSWEPPSWAPSEPLQKELENIYRSYTITSQFGPPTPNYAACNSMSHDKLFRRDKAGKTNGDGKSDKMKMTAGSNGKMKFSTGMSNGSKRWNKGGTGKKNNIKKLKIAEGWKSMGDEDCSPVDETPEQLNYWLPTATKNSANGNKGIEQQPTNDIAPIKGRQDLNETSRQHCNDDINIPDLNQHHRYGGTTKAKNPEFMKAGKEYLYMNAASQGMGVSAVGNERQADYDEVMRPKFSLDEGDEADDDCDIPVSVLYQSEDVASSCTMSPTQYSLAGVSSPGDMLLSTGGGQQQQQASNGNSNLTASQKYRRFAASRGAPSSNSLSSRNSIPDEVPGRYMMHGCASILTPTRSEYTSITDDIDTTCVNYISPHGSPVALHHGGGSAGNKCFFSNHPLSSPASVDDAVDALTAAAGSLSPQKEVIQNEAEQLKKAEESEHQQMELMIMKRMRHISLTDTDSLGDIAKHIVNEMEMTKESSSEQSVYSDNAVAEMMEAMSSSDGESGSGGGLKPCGVKKKRGLKHVKSAPAFHVLRPIMRQSHVESVGGEHEVSLNKTGDNESASNNKPGNSIKSPSAKPQKNKPNSIDSGCDTSQFECDVVNSMEEQILPSSASKNKKKVSYSAHVSRA